jgi:hypothetical protein
MSPKPKQAQKLPGVGLRECQKGLLVLFCSSQNSDFGFGFRNGILYFLSLHVKALAIFSVNVFLIFLSYSSFGNGIVSFHAWYVRALAIFSVNVLHFSDLFVPQVEPNFGNNLDQLKPLAKNIHEARFSGNIAQIIE